MRRLLLATLLLATGAGVSPAHATGGHGGHGDVRFATYNLSLNRPAAGMLREQLAAPDVDDVYRRQAKNVAEVIQRAHPDVVLINEFDFDPEAARLFAENFLAVSQNGAPAQRYRYRYVAPSNTGGVGCDTRKWTVFPRPTVIGTSQWLFHDSRRTACSSGE